MLSAAITITAVTGTSAMAFIRRRLFGIAVVLVVLLSNISSLIVYYISPELSRVAYLVAARELTTYTALIIGFFALQHARVPIGHPIDRIFLGLGLFFAMSIALSLPRTGSAAVLMGRELVFPVATYLLFRFINPDKMGLTLIIRLVLGLAIVGAMLGVAEYILLNWIDKYFWYRVEISGYLAQKYGSFEGPYPLSWVNYLPGLFGLPIGLRSIGLMTDPLASAHFLACSFAIALFHLRGFKKWIAVLIIGAGVAVTFSKAGLLLCFLAFGSQALKIRQIWLRWAVLGFIGGVVGLLGVVLLSTGDDSFTHAGSFRAGLEALINNPIGHGIGSTGYFAFLVTGDIAGLEAIDTTFSVYTYQMGLPGLIALFLIAFLPAIYLVRLVARQRRSGGTSPLTLSCAMMFGSYAFLSLSTAAAFNAVQIFLPMMLLGVQVASEVATARQAVARPAAMQQPRPYPL